MASHAPSARIPIILDTDIGEDLDDLLTLAAALNSPELEVVAVTTVYGDTAARSRIARRVTGVYGQGHIPVAAGYTRPMPREAEGVAPLASITQNEIAPSEEGLPPPCPLSADELIAKLAAERPGQIYLLSIGAVTNVGQTLVRRPEVARDLKAIVSLNGLSSPPGVPYHDWNFNYDPAAVAVLAASAANWILVSWGLCGNVGPRPEVEQRIRDRGLPTTDVIAAAIDAWRKNKPEVEPDSPPAGGDMRILAYLLSREKVRQSRGRVFVTVGSEEMVGSLRIEEDPAGPHTFVHHLEKPRADRLREMFTERLLAEPIHAAAPP